MLMELARRVAKNTFYNVSALILGNVSGLFLTIILARILKPEQFGIYSLALSIAMLATSLSSLGIDGAVVRYTAYYVGINDIESVRGHLRYFVKVRLILSVFVSLALIVSSKVLAEFFGDSRLVIPFVISGSIVFFYSLVCFLDAFFKGLQRFEYTLLKQIVYETSRWVFVIPLAMMYLAVGALIGFSIAFAVALTLLFVIFIFKYLYFIRGDSKPVTSRVNAFMGYMTIASLSGLIYAYVDTIMIGYFLTPTDVGFYRAAYTIVFAVVELISSVSVVLFPTFTQLSFEDINKALDRLTRYVSVLTYPLALFMILLSKDIIKIIYGMDYLPAVKPIVVLAFTIIPGTFGYLYTIFNAKEKPEIVALLNICGMIVNIVLNYYFILRFGIVGAAFATVASRSLMIAVVVVLLYKWFNIMVNAKTMSKPLISIGIAILVLFCIKDIFHSTALKLLIAYILYLGILIITKTLTIDDIRYLRAIVK
jgi:O-antigen/teichoic acid export membrane protein